MSSSFKGKETVRFRSAPLRDGEAWSVGGFELCGLGGGDATSVYLGLLEMDITVHREVQASTEAALWTLRDAVIAELLDPPTAGTLVDLNGRS